MNTKKTKTEITAVETTEVEEVELEDVEEEVVEPEEYKPTYKGKRFRLDRNAFYQATKLGIHFESIPAAALDDLKAEVNFVLEDGQTIKEPDLDEIRLIGTDKKKCSICDGAKRVGMNFRGVRTGILTTMPCPCPCIAYRNFFFRWEDPLIVPSNFREITLEGIDEYRSRFRTFLKYGTYSMLMKTVSEYPHACYLLAGPGGTGKTTLMTALYQAALANWAKQSYERNLPVEAVWKVSALQLSQQFRDWALRDMNSEDREGRPVPRPIVTEDKVRAALNAGYQPCLFIEELDKYNHTGFQNNGFLNAIDMIQSNHGQVVATSNLSEFQLRSALGEQYGKPVVRRFTDKPLGTLLDFEYGTIVAAVDKPEGWDCYSDSSADPAPQPTQSFDGFSQNVPTQGHVATLHLRRGGHRGSVKLG
jgi:ATPase family associated with various cellular activities (AAA)